MRIAILADIHGNSIALDAVLADCGDVDQYLMLGDYCAIGPDPVGVLERIASLPNALFVRGNTDRYLVTHTYPPPHADQVKADLSRLDVFADVRAQFGWGRGMVQGSGWLDWLNQLAFSAQLTLPNQARLLAIHANPARDEGPGIDSKSTDEQLQTVFSGQGVDLILGGHTHDQHHRQLPDLELLNPGSIGNPLRGDRQAGYAILEADQDGYTIELRRVAYDYKAFIEMVRAVNMPGGEFVISHVLPSPK